MQQISLEGLNVSTVRYGTPERTSRPLKEHGVYNHLKEKAKERARKERARQGGGKGKEGSEPAGKRKKERKVWKGPNYTLERQMSI